MHFFGGIILFKIALYQEVEGSGFTSSLDIQKNLGWAKERAQRVLINLAKDGMAWIDDQGGNSSIFYFPSLWKGNHYLDVEKNDAGFD